MSRFEFDFCVAADHPCLPGHFPGRPIVPGVLVLDHVLQALRRLTGRDVAHLHQVKFTSVLRPGEQVHACCDVEHDTVRFQVSVQRDGISVAMADGKARLAPVKGEGRA